MRTSPKKTKEIKETFMVGQSLESVKEDVCSTKLTRIRSLALVKKFVVQDAVKSQ